MQPSASASLKLGAQGRLGLTKRDQSTFFKFNIVIY